MDDVLNERSDKAETGTSRQRRADAQRNVATLLEVAKEVFAEAGVDAPIRAIAERAGLGTGTIYRHFPRRADLIAAVFWQEIDDCVEAADALAANHPPGEALARWMGRFVDLALTKQGLAQALHSGDPAFASLPERRERRLHPVMRNLFAAAQAAGDIHSGIDADNFLNAAAYLCMAAKESRPEQARQMVDLLVRGLLCNSSSQV